MSSPHLTGGGATGETAAEWKQAMAEMQERLDGQAADYEIWLEQVHAALNRLDQDLDASTTPDETGERNGDASPQLRSSETDEDLKLALGRAADLVTSAREACAELVEQRVKDVRRIIERAGAVSSYLMQALNGSNDQAVIDKLESSDCWRSLVAIPERTAEMNRAALAIEAVVETLRPAIDGQEERDASPISRAFWAVASMKPYNRMESTVLWDCVHDGSVRRLLPGVAPAEAQRTALGS